MINMSKNPNTVYVSIVSNGCLKQQFDKTYPVQLKELISEDEYQDSIDRINREMNPNRTLLILAFIFVASMISGMIFIITTGINEDNSDTSGFMTLLIVTVLGIIVFGIGFCYMHLQHIIRIRQAIDVESIKYSLKLTIPCTWRLETTGNHIGGLGKNQLVIDIDHWTIQENNLHYMKSDTNKSSSTPEKDDYELPPPYCA